MSEATPRSRQARIGEATDAAKFVESISYDRRIYKQDVAGSVAHATMLAEVGLITEAERDAIIGGLRSIEAGTFAFDEGLEDIRPVVEAALIERVGEPGRKLHTATVPRLLLRLAQAALDGRRLPARRWTAC